MPCSITPVRTGAAPSPAIVPVTFPDTKPSRVNIEPARFGTGFTFRFDASTVRSHPSSVVTVCAFDSNGVGVADATVPPARNSAVLAVLGRHVGDTRWAGAWPPSAVWRR